MVPSSGNQQQTALKLLSDEKSFFNGDDSNPRTRFRRLQLE